MADPKRNLPPRGSEADQEDVNARAKQAASPFVLPPEGILETGTPFGSHPEDFPEHPDTERTAFDAGSDAPPTTPAPIQHTPHDDADLVGDGLPIGGSPLALPGPQMDEEPQAEPGTALTLPPEQPIASEDPEAKRAAIALYGSDFPLLLPNPDEKAWVKWGKTRWDAHRPGMQKTLHMVERNRLMRGGDQWVTSTGVGPWREPPKPRDAVRAVENVIQPALDQRVQIVREQAPGFRTRPTTRDPEAMKRAEAQQLALEYAYAEQGMAEVLAEAAYWAGTDGVAFLGPYWHPDAGPWAETEQQPLGDIRTCVYRIEQVRVSANATATKKPHYWIIRETIPAADAVAMHGVAGVGDASGSGTDLATTMQSGRLGLDTPGVDELYRDQETVDRYTVYCERSDFLPNGLTLITAGENLIFAGPLLYSVVPMARITDGSADPAFYPTPVMNGWVPHQVRINALVSKWIESIRVNAGGRFLMKSGTTATETLVGGTTSMLEVKGAFNAIQDVLLPVNGFSVGQDVKDALEREVLTFEKKSGWNDASRGSFASDASGRAILAVREQLERIFAPGVSSAAKAMTEWGKITLHIYRAMLTLPRTISIAGKGRPDLARELTAEDFDCVSQVEIDPETLMPMPRSMRLYILDQLYDKQVITPQEYRKRQPFAFTGQISTPDDAQESRAQRVADAIKNGQPVPELRWTDNEAIHQDILEREILLVDSLNPMIVQMAMQRWVLLAQQAAMKGGGMMPGMEPQGSPPDGTPLPPQSAPLPGSNPGMAAAPQQLSQSDQQSAGSSFDQISPS